MLAENGRADYEKISKIMRVCSIIRADMMSPVTAGIIRRKQRQNDKHGDYSSCDSCNHLEATESAG